MHGLRPGIIGKTSNSTYLLRVLRYLQPSANELRNVHCIPQFPYVARLPWSGSNPQQGQMEWSVIDMDPYVNPYVDYRGVALNPDSEIKQAT